MGREMGINTCFCLGTFEKSSNREYAAALAVDHINLSGWNPLIGENDEILGPRFPDMSGVYTKDIREQLKEKFTQIIGTEIFEMVLVGVQDPSYLSDAEKLGLLGIKHCLYTNKFIFEAIAATYATLNVGTVLLNSSLELNSNIEKKIVQYFASLTDN